MANILSVENLTHHWGDIRLFNSLTFGLEEGEKAALIARNGTGKTTLLNILAGKQVPDGGTVTIRKGIRTGYLVQDPVFPAGKTVIESLLSGDNELIKAVRDYEEALESNDQALIGKMVEKMDAMGAWDYETRVRQVLDKLKITRLNQPVEQLSGGQQKRLALAAVLLEEPDFIILDEPTNHLDIDMVDWLEDYLSRNRATLLMVTHDRFFLDRVCNVIFEMDDETLYKYTGNYSYFLEKRDERIDQRNQEIDRARNLLRKEQDWMNRQPQARATKAKYRIDAYYELKEVAGQKTREADLSIDIKASRLGTKVLNFDNVSKGFNGKTLIRDFSYKFAKGEKIGILGSNGTGKSTLLNIINGDIKPDTGSIELGETVVVGYYRQEGIKFDENKKVIEVISEIADDIDAGNGRRMDAAQFLRYFLFPNEMHYVPVSKLSGGEKKRLYLMTVLMKNPNFLILDEPTNDLDVYTLGVLEDYLDRFEGCVLAVSHDRYFLDRVVDQMFVFQDGFIKVFPGNYSRYHEYIKENAKPAEPKIKKPVAEKREPSRERQRRLSFKEKKELEELEKRMAALEEEKKALEEMMSSGAMASDELIKASERMGVLLKELDECEMRWLVLSEIEG